MKSRSMELWGIEDHKFVDPIIELFLDVFSYELSKVHQEIKLSDAKLLERLSKILVNENWSLPMPSHALIQAKPSEQLEVITPNTELYYQKRTQSGAVDVFFTPMQEHTLIHADLYCVGLSDTLQFEQFSDISIKANKEKQIKDHTIWIGIDIEKELLQEIDQLPLCILLGASNLNAYLKMVKIFDYDGNELQLFSSKKNKTTSKEHYYDTVDRYYQDYLHTIDLKASSKTKHTVSSKFETIFDEEEIKELDKELFWLQLSFPVAFVKEELENLSISLNTFPIINRKSAYRQHQIKKNGKIVSLIASDQEYFLNVESLIDESGNEYKNTLKNDISNLEGSYSLYSGDIEQFDERNAKALLNRVIQTVREEGSSFSAIGYDLLNAYLEDLHSKLDTLEQKVNFRYKNISDHNNKLYLLTIPYKTSETYECYYWTTTADFANGIDTDTLFSQYQSGGLQPDSIRLQTKTVGGIIKNGTKDKIDNLRYGLISKDRIVSNEDVKAFIKQAIGSAVKDVQIRSGVAISPNKKQGLVRTIHVDIVFVANQNFSEENKHHLARYLQLELENKSVHNTPYSIHII